MFRVQSSGLRTWGLGFGAYQLDDAMHQALLMCVCVCVCVCVLCV